MQLDLFTPFTLGFLTLANRMVMAPMTRNRADQTGVATPLMADYYAQRAEAGLIISESVPVSAQGVGYPCTPGMYTEEQVQGWRHVTAAVHERGGLMFAQLQHCGRVSHPSMQAHSAVPVAPSALKPDGQAFTYTGAQDFVTPRALATEEMPSIVKQFQDAAVRAKQAGFDGIEVHGANGYLIDQFLRDGSNQRTDDYGGSVANRLRLLVEILHAVCAVWPADRVGVRLSPENTFNSMTDSDPLAHFGYFIERLGELNLAFVHVLEGDMMTKTTQLDYHQLLGRFDGVYIANNGYDLERAKKAVWSRAADLVAFGLPFLANPDLVTRYRNNLPLNEADQASFYGGGADGYTDYPVHETMSVV
ncbi:MAG: alkene reductase [Burkholderiaceae bacterium]|nr:alkene reductase [Burkholderiaceae bacterium]